jgi:hypothetical protein
MTRNIEKAAAEFEKMIRKEIGSSSPIPWTVDELQKKQTAGSSVDEFLKVFGGNLEIKTGLVYNLPGPFSSQLHVGVIQPGINTFPAILQFTADLSKPFSDKATFTQRSPGTGIFQGDPELCGKLNSNKEILSLASSLYLGKYNFNRVVIDISPFVGVTGDGTVSHLLVRKVLTVKGGFIKAALFQAKEFLQLCSLVDPLL